MKKINGFTLVELLAVIVILSILIGLGSIASVNAINKSKEKAARVERGVLKDAAETYAIAELSNVLMDTCPVNFDYKNYASYPTCAKAVTVKTLVDNNFFDNDKKRCKDDTLVIVYNDAMESIKAELLDEKACSN